MEEKEPRIIELNLMRIAKVNFWLTILLSILFLAANSMIHGQFHFHITFWNFMLFLTGYFVLIILHELFHQIGFVIFGKAKWKQLDYGINTKLGVAYATTKKPLPNHAMKKALMLPFWTTGMIPSIAGFICNSQLLVLLGAFLIAGAVGDFYMYRELRKFPKDALVKDDPLLPKLYVYQ
ncbi:DUF3267 domain-containing protein [Ureibacillus thermophilus]|uniref:DUF3267 domain-containing protein n=1 Tax=Ureibacillus thermophilus TaxID=367743 RepID=A0A4P6UPC3_9BACL|nr:DUF3267 domain-containing protein [Ureibacillus thermophilus]QBK24834.1 DUF3267 domain-containing protein [Ureibacillus thermophilus]